MENWNILKNQNRKRLFIENEFKEYVDDFATLETIVDCKFNTFFNKAIFGVKGNISEELTTSIKECDDIFINSALVGNESYYLFQALVEFAYRNEIKGKRLFVFREKRSLQYILSDLYHEYDMNDVEDVKFLEAREDIRILKTVFSNNKLFFLDTYDGSL